MPQNFFSAKILSQGTVIFVKIELDGLIFSGKKVSGSKYLIGKENIERNSW